MPVHTVLVLTRTFDPTADLVISELNRRDVPVVRVDRSDLPDRAGVTAWADCRGWTGHLRTDHREVELSAIGAVYYRRPTSYQVGSDLSGTDREWADTEAKYGFDGLWYAFRSCRWVNRPDHSSFAEYKPVQLAVAAECGLQVPATLITNNPDEARSFARTHPSGVVYKPLRGAPESEQGRPVALFTTAITADDITDGVSRTAHLFQRNLVDKLYDVRVTVVGDRIFAVRIDAGTDAARQDWRADYRALTYTRISVSAAVADGIHRLMRLLRLRFGALDFTVTPDGWYFLEVNANGQWGWVALGADIPVASALADLLQQPRKHL